METKNTNINPLAKVENVVKIIIERLKNAEKRLSNIVTKKTTPTQSWWG